jgi:1-acyl-sn-glycerol-3-phosphate acyltransferase
MNPFKYLKSNNIGDQTPEYKMLVVKTYVVVLKVVIGKALPNLVKGIFAGITGNKNKRNQSFLSGSVLWGDQILKDTKTTLFNSNELIVPEKGHMIFINHVNELDFPFDCIKVNKPFLANQTIKNSYIAYWWMSAMGSQVFDVSKQRTILASVKNLVAGLSETSYIVYPEGTNTYSEEIKPLKKGMVKVSFENKIPIVIIIKSGVQRLQVKQKGNTIGYRYVGRVEPEKFSSHEEMKEHIFQLMVKEKAILDDEVRKANEKNN